MRMIVIRVTSLSLHDFRYERFSLMSPLLSFSLPDMMRFSFTDIRGHTHTHTQSLRGGY